MFLEQFPNEGRQTGWIEVICGSMFSGKTEELIRRLRRAEFANQKLLLFKPHIDDRYSKDRVVSHQGNHFHAIVVEKSTQILERWNNEKVKVVAIDEAQFFDHELADVCTELAKKGVRVMLAGLDMDYQGTAFGPMPQLMAVAEYVTKVHAICVSCGNLAHYSQRTVQQTEQVLVGAIEKYRPLCRTCYHQK